MNQVERMRASLIMVRAVGAWERRTLEKVSRQVAGPQCTELRAQLSFYRIRSLRFLKAAFPGGYGGKEKKKEKGKPRLPVHKENAPGARTWGRETKGGVWRKILIRS